MAGKLLTTLSKMQCPHGGMVLAISTNTKVMVDNGQVLTVNDTFTIAGCPFTLPGPVPSPCLTIQWLVTDMMLKVNQVPTLSDSSVGLCLSPSSAPQGKVVMVSTQQVVSGL